MRVSRPLIVWFAILNWKSSDLWLLMNKLMWLNPVLAKLLTLRVIKNSLRRTRDIKMFQRKEILRHVRSLSVLRKIRAS